MNYYIDIKNELINNETIGIIFTEKDNKLLL